MDVSDITNIDYMYPSSSLLRCAFERMDVSETGRITLDDLTTVLGAHYDHAELKELLDAADANHDGTLDYAEFEVLMRSTVGKTR